MEELSKLRDVKIEENYALFSINPKIYPLEVVYYAAYIMIDKAFILLDGDPEKDIRVEIRKKKENQDLKELLTQFNEELLNYSVYLNQSKKTANIRQILLAKALSGVKDDKTETEQ